MQWFRWYRGTSEDAKFRVTARNAGVTVSTVIAVWAVLLEDASHPEHRGVVHKDEDWIATLLDLENGVAEAVLAAMQDQKMISVGAGNITITNWDKRQFEGDADRTNAERQRRWRERKKSTVTGNASVTRYGNASVTHQKTEDREQKDKIQKATPSGAEAPQSPLDLKKALWASGVAYLKANGVSEANARSFIGLMRKTHSDVAIVDAFARAEAEAAADPVAFIKATLGARHATGSKIHRKRHHTTAEDVEAFGRALAGFKMDRPAPKP